MFEKNPNNSPYACWGVECGRGWYNLLETLLTKLDVLDTAKIIRVTQIKEKFGTLRFYIGGGTEEQYSAINLAELMSSNICERCGKFDSSIKPSTDSCWVSTRCKECQKQKEKK